jgi:flagellar P-ring protein precursor FlgI
MPVSFMRQAVRRTFPGGLKMTAHWRWAVTSLLFLSGFVGGGEPEWFGPYLPDEPPVKTNGSASASLIRIKDAADVAGVRENQLVGQGLVIGLDGTGDKSGDQLPQALANLSQRFGVTVSRASFKSKNVAVVIVTASLPPFAKKGSQLDVQVSSTGDAKSLQGGILIQTPLTGADGLVYAVAQGAVSVGGFEVKSRERIPVQKNHLLVGNIPGGALVEREVPMQFVQNNVIRLCLRRPDFTAAKNLAAALNERWADCAGAADFAEVRVALPQNYQDGPADAVRFLSEVEQVRFPVDDRARVVVNERTGTIVVGGNVRLEPTVIHHANLVIRVIPDDLSAQKTKEGENRELPGADDQVRMESLGSASLAQLTKSLQKLGKPPRDIIAILQALKSAGALHAELIVM